MKDILSCVHVIVKTLNLEISRCYWQTASMNCFKVRTARAATCSTVIFPHSSNQMIVFWRRRCRCCRPCLKLRIKSRHIRWGRPNFSSTSFPGSSPPFTPLEWGDEKSWELGWFLISYLTSALTKASLAQARYYQEWGWAEKRERGTTYWLIA